MIPKYRQLIIMISSVLESVLVYPENVFDTARGIEQVLLDEQCHEQLRFCASDTYVVVC